MSASNSLETSLLSHILNNADIANIGDATGLRGSSTAGSLYLSLHTSDPGEAGDQTTNEISYTSYARVAVARAAAWTVAGASATLAALTAFAASTGGAGGTVTHFGLGTASSGAGVLLFKGTVTPNIVVSSGVTPRLTTSTAITCD